MLAIGGNDKSNDKMLTSQFFCYAGCAVAARPRQIVVDASPPPPITAIAVPGAGFSVAIPQYTGSTWTTANSATLCAGLVNATSGK